MKTLKSIDGKSLLIGGLLAAVIFLSTGAKQEKGKFEIVDGELKGIRFLAEEFDSNKNGILEGEEMNKFLNRLKELNAPELWFDHGLYTGERMYAYKHAQGLMRQLVAGAPRIQESPFREATYIDKEKPIWRVTTLRDLMFQARELRKVFPHLSPHLSKALTHQGWEPFAVTVEKDINTGAEIPKEYYRKKFEMESNPTGHPDLFRLVGVGEKWNDPSNPWYEIDKNAYK